MVSIITPLYNSKEYFQKTYESVISQTFSDWEWIIVEDHSTDGSLNQIQNLIKNDKRITLLRTEKNSGAAIARNLGIEQAKGRYIAFLDADDLFKPEKLEKQIKFMEKNGYAFTFTDYDLLYSNGKVRRYSSKKKVISYKDLLKNNYIGCLTAIYDTALLGKVYMPADCQKREDYGAWLDILKKGIFAYGLDESLSIYRISGDSVSSNKFKMIKHHYAVYRKHEGFGVAKSLWFLLLCTFNKIFNKY